MRFKYLERRRFDWIGIKENEQLVIANEPQFLRQSHPHLV